MNLNKDQISTLADYFSDVSKILVGSIVIAYFVPTEPAVVNEWTLLGGLTTAIVFLFIGIILNK
ncbi:MAG: hypothetical protein Q8Q95_04080 [bacterium]|nr:hypothetical protein [bacterium]